jgi:hypothetical protein
VTPAPPPVPSAGRGRSRRELPHQGGQRQQILDAEARSAGRERDERIRRDDVRPGSRDRAEAPGGVVEGDPIFAPGLAVAQQLKTPTVQRMERMGDLNPSRTVAIRRS